LFEGTYLRFLTEHIFGEVSSSEDEDEKDVNIMDSGDEYIGEEASRSKMAEEDDDEDDDEDEDDDQMTADMENGTDCIFPELICSSYHVWIFFNIVCKNDRILGKKFEEKFFRMLFSVNFHAIFVAIPTVSQDLNNSLIALEYACIRVSHLINLGILTPNLSKHQSFPEIRAKLDVLSMQIEELREKREAEEEKINAIDNVALRVCNIGLLSRQVLFRKG
jgi:hypothetical protein